MKKSAFFPAARLVVFILAGVMVNSCATNPVTGKKELMLLSESQEIAMGAESVPGIVASFGLFQDDKLQAFINEKGQQMAKISHRPDLKYEFKILDSPVVNAFALPGGYVYFTRGILAYFNDEAQFAGVLGHETGHVTARHSARQYSKQLLAQGGLILGVVLSKEIAQYADAASQGLGLLFLKFSRDNESEADRLGVEYSTKVGYNAHEMADFFITLDRISGGPEGRIPTFMSTHPDPADRNVKVEELATQWQQQYPNSKNVGRDSYLRMIDGIIYGEDPKQGFVENDYFYHPELRFQFPVPTGWAVENTPQAVQMAPQDGKAALIMTLAQGTSLQAAADAALKQYNMAVVSQQNTTVGNYPALAIVADIQPDQTQQQASTTAAQQVRALLYFIQYNNNIYQFMGLSYQTDFSSYEPRFLNTMKNFRELTDQEKINRQPDRIHIKSVAQTGTLEQALKAYGTTSDKLEELAILNGMQLNDQVTKGMLIKTLGK